MSDVRHLRLGRTLRRGLRAWWDHLGLACALSAFWTIVAGVTTGMVLQYASAPGAPAMAAGAVVAVCALAWATAGIHRAVFQAIEGDEPGAAWLFRLDAGITRQAVGLAAIQIVGVVGLALNIAFYLSLRSPVGIVLGVIFGYMLVLWLSACQYQWPLFTAGAMGIIRRDDGSRPRLGSVLRNAFLLTLAAPLYALALGAAVAAIVVPLTLTGVGLVLIVPGLAAFVTTQAVRDHMVRFGMLPPPDEGGPVPDSWRVPGA